VKEFIIHKLRDLSLGQEVCHHSAFHGIVDIGIFKDDDRRLSSELQRDVLDSLV